MANLIATGTPKQAGYRMPAEWEKHSAIWLQWPQSHPHAKTKHPLHYQMKLEDIWLAMTWEIHRHAKACVLAQNGAHRRHILGTMEYFGFDLNHIEIHISDMADVWHRDSGPIFVVNDKGELAATDWNFNGWGSYPAYAVAERHIAKTVAAIADVPVFDAPIVTEGGAIEVNGTGSFMATRSSIINDNRNPGVGQDRIEDALCEYLGVSNYIWLSGAPAEICEKELGDSTDYHIDIAARFVGKNKILYSWTDDQNDPRYPFLIRHLEELRAATDEDGEPLTLIPLQLPDGGVYTIGDRHDAILDSGSRFTDASYANFLITNNLVLVPAFGNVNDVKAQDVLVDCFPDREVVPIPAVALTAEGGTIHCVTQQQPAV